MLSKLLLTLCTLLLLATPALAACPKDASPDLSVCKYSTSTLSPRFAARTYLPGSGTQWVGGSVGVHLLTWSDNSSTFGPSQGEYFLDLGIVTDVAKPGHLGWSLRAGAHGSFEGNASRNWLIPYYGVAAGWGWGGLSGLLFAEPRLGVYLFRGDRVTVDLNAGYVLPFFDFARRSGLSGQLSLAFSLW